MSQQTQVAAVVFREGVSPACPHHPRGRLYEVIEGEHSGLRGCIECIERQVGSVSVDPRLAVLFETGEIFEREP